jgi:two-component system OmpR family sensor kinase
MSFLPLGRLFWKFLIFFFLAQLTAVFGIGLAIWAIKPEHEFGPRPPYSSNPPNQYNPYNSPGTAQQAHGEYPPAFAPPHPPGGEAYASGGEAPPLPPRFGEPPQPRGPKPPLFHLLAGAVVSLLFAALLAAYVSRPILRLRQAMQAGAKGDLSAGLSAAMGNRRDELADLGQDFDRMAQHISQLMEGQRRLLHDVSHELRSPLARLNAIIGLARQQPEFLVDCLSRLEHESMRMDRLLSELLTLSRLESGMTEPGVECVDLAELLTDVVSDAAPEIEQAGCKVELKNSPRAVLRGDPEMLHRVFDNLLRNALTHAAAGGWVGIELSLAESGSKAIVRVEDCGPGVAERALEHLFVPFYRASPRPGKNGYGLGLAIARRIVEHHHGRIEATRRTPCGLCLTVSLPLLEPLHST